MEQSKDNTPFMHRVRIVATGGECTGKTTLVTQLSEFFGTPCSNEAARDYVNKLGRAVQYSDVETIAKHQIAIEDQVSASNSRMIFLDTDLFSTLIYSHFYFEQCPDWIEPACNARRADLYLLCGFDLPWIEDEFQRGKGDSESRQAIHHLFSENLCRAGCNIVEISGPDGARLNQAISAVKKQVGDHK